jgi:hypothetical protein
MIACPGFDPRQLAAMVPPFDIFKRQGGGSVRWLGVATDLEAAKLRVRELTESAPGEYFIFSLATGHRLTVRPDDVHEGSEAKKAIPESQEGPPFPTQA